MQLDWLKPLNDDYWTAQLGSYHGTVFRTQFGSYTYLVGDAVRL